MSAYKLFFVGFVLLTAHRAASAATIQSTWERKAFGQPQICGITWPNNRKWNQQQGAVAACPAGSVLTAPSNWTTTSFPNNGNGDTYQVTIDDFPAVELPIAVTIDTLRIDKTGELDILQAGRLQVALGQITVIGDPTADPDTGDGGNIRLLGQPGNPATTAELQISGSTSLLGSGDLQFSSSGGNKITPVNAGNNALNDVLTIGPEFTIKHPGSQTHGLIEVLMINNGTINANGPQDTPFPTSMGRIDIDYSNLPGTINTMTNNGQLLATDGGKLLLKDVRVDNAGGASVGTITVDANSTVELNTSSSSTAQTRIVGGTIEGQGTVKVSSGQIVFNGSGIGDGGAVTINGTTIKIEDLRKLKAIGTINNNGKIEIIGNTQGSPGVVAKFQPQGNVTLGGTGVLEFTSGIRGAITHSTTTTEANDFLTLGTGQVVQTGGSGTAGTIGVQVTNNGVIDANGGEIDVDYRFLPGSVNTLTNNNELKATSGGRLELTDVTVNNVAAISAGKLKIDGTNSKIVLNNSGVPGKKTSIVGGTIEGDGSIVVSGSDVTFDGSGAAGLAIDGTTIAIDPGRRLRLKGSVTNRGTIELAGNASGANELRIKDNVTIDGDGDIRVSGSGSNIISQSGVPGALVMLLDGEQTLRVEANSSLELRTGLANRATIDVDGTFRLSGTNAQLSNDLGGTIQGNGTINLNNARLTSSGTVAPGNSAGQLMFQNGSFEQTATGTLEFEIGGTVAGTDFDRLTVNGPTTLDGMLDVSLINGFIPNVGQQFDVLTAASIVDNGLTLIGADAQLFEMTVGISSVLLEFAGLPADFDGDGDVDGDDFLRWQASFGIDDGGDADNDGDTDGDDFLIWQSQFGNALGATSRSGSASVPEPAAITLLIGFALVGVMARRRFDRSAFQG